MTEEEFQMAQERKAWALSHFIERTCYCEFVAPRKYCKACAGFALSEIVRGDVP